MTPETPKRESDSILKLTKLPRLRSSLPQRSTNQTPLLKTTRTRRRLLLPAENVVFIPRFLFLNN